MSENTNQNDKFENNSSNDNSSINPNVSIKHLHEILQNKIVYSPMNQTFELLLKNLKSTANDVELKEIEETYGIDGEQKINAFKSVTVLITLFNSCDYIYHEFHQHLNNKLKQEFIDFKNLTNINLDTLENLYSTLEEQLIEVWEGTYDPNEWREANLQYQLFCEDERKYEAEILGLNSDNDNGSNNDTEQNSNF